MRLSKLPPFLGPWEISRLLGIHADRFIRFIAKGTSPLSIPPISTLKRGKEIPVNQVSVQSTIENLEQIICQMLKAQSDEDWVLLSDLLEYELLPSIESWKEILPEIEKTARKTERKAEKREGNRE
jgi:hypothetical protein